MYYNKKSGFSFRVKIKSSMITWSINLKKLVNMRKKIDYNITFKVQAKQFKTSFS